MVLGDSWLDEFPLVEGCVHTQSLPRGRDATVHAEDLCTCWLLFQGALLLPGCVAGSLLSSGQPKYSLLKEVSLPNLLKGDPLFSSSHAHKFSFLILISLTLRVGAHACVCVHACTHTHAHASFLHQPANTLQREVGHLSYSAVPNTVPGVQRYKVSAE